MEEHSETKDLKQNLIQKFLEENPEFFKRGIENLVSFCAAVIDNESDFSFL